MSARELLVGLGLVVGLAGACRAPQAGPQAPGTGERPLQVAFLVVDGVYNSELFAPLDVFQHTIFHTEPGMQVWLVGRTRRPVTTFEGQVVAVDHDLSSAPEIDVLVVPSAEHSMDSDLEDAALLDWVAERGGRARHVVSLCDGAFVLAAAGLLEGRTCTTFPGDVQAFRERFPALDVREGVLYVHDGPTITSAGGAQSYAPALHLVEQLYGSEVARGVGRGLVIDWDASRVPHLVVD